MLLCFATDHEAEARQAYPQATQCAHLGGHPPAVARYGAWWAEARYLILKRASGCLLLTWMCADGDCGQKNEDRRALTRLRADGSDITRARVTRLWDIRRCLFRSYYTAQHTHKARLYK